jgi:bifunctional DNA-binding transcriptional regulator/antitoxin component of YhaV-PrlF toxin-antitoxin module
MVELTLSARHQIVIPREAGRALGLKAGDKLLAVVCGTRMLVLKKPDKHHAAIRGLAARPYPDTWLDDERDSWD